MKPRIPLPDGTRIDPQWGPDLTPINPEIREAFVRLSHATVNQDGIDPVMSELVRLRNAAVQGCRVCMSMRSAAALELGPFEHLVGQIGDLDSTELSEDQILAVRLADVYLHDPSGMTDALRDRLLERFTPSQLLEIVLRVAVNSWNKVRVSLSLDIEQVGYMVYLPVGLDQR